MDTNTIWQLVRRWLNRCDMTTHKPDVTTRVNGFGVVMWSIEILDGQNCVVYRCPYSWATWQESCRHLTNWLKAQYKQAPPLEFNKNGLIAYHGSEDPFTFSIAEKDQI